MMIGQEGPLTPAEQEVLHNNRNSEIVRIFRKQLSYLYGQKAALLISEATVDKLQVKQGELRGLALAWNVPFQVPTPDKDESKKVLKPIVV